MAIPSPAGIAVRKGPAGTDELLVADNLSDDVLLMDGVTGKVLRRFDLSQGKVVPSTYPISIAVNRSGSRAYVALWNGSAVAELDLNNGKVLKKLELLAPRDSHVRPVRIRPPLPGARTRRFSTWRWPIGMRWPRCGLAGTSSSSRASMTRGLPGQTYFGAMPDAVAVSEDGKRLFAANTGSDAVAVFDSRAAAQGSPCRGLVPTEWYPTALAVKGNKLYVATAKGQGTGPNKMPQPPVPGDAGLQPQLHLHRHPAAWSIGRH